MSLFSTFFALTIFAVVLISKVESLGARLLLGGIVAALYFFLGSLMAMIAAVIFSIGILIHSQLPTTSGM